MGVMAMKRDNYRRLMFLPVLIILTELYIIGYCALNKDNDIYTRSENGILYTAGEIDTKSYDDLATDTDSLPNKEVSDKTDKTEAVSEEPKTAEKININKANAEELMKLPGIGEKMSKRIIETRERMGGYRSIEDIMNVSGIGEKKFEKMKELITVE